MYEDKVKTPDCKVIKANVNDSNSCIYESYQENYKKYHPILLFSRKNFSVHLCKRLTNWRGRGKESNI